MSTELFEIRVTKDQISYLADALEITIEDALDTNSKDYDDSDITEITLLYDRIREFYKINCKQ